MDNRFFLHNRRSANNLPIIQFPSKPVSNKRNGYMTETIGTADVAKNQTITISPTNSETLTENGR